MMMRTAIRLLALGVLLTQYPACVYLNYNLRTVDEGVLYRSGQMPANHLETTLNRHDIQTVISLRGVNPDEVWYQQEVAQCETLGVAHYSLPWSKNRLPDPDSLVQLLDWYDNADRPMLVHCQGGTHRSGIAAAVYVLHQGGSVEDARAQLDIFFNDAPIGQLLDLYEGSPLPFREWVEHEYPSLYAQYAATP